MKQKTAAIIAVVSCALLAFNSVKLVRLQEELALLRSHTDTEINTLNRNIGEIYAGVSAKLEEGAAQLISGVWECGEIDVQTRTAEILCTVVPKVYSPDTTQVALICNGQEYAMQYADNRYSAVITLPLFETAVVSMVKLNDSGTIRTQELGWFVQPRYEVLPLTYAGIGGSARGTHGNGEYVWEPNCAVRVNVECKQKFRIQSVEFVEVLDGVEISRTAVDISKEGQEAYQTAIRKQNLSMQEFGASAVESSGVSDPGDLQFLYHLNRQYHIPNGSTLEFYVDVVDGNGFCYRSFADCFAVGTDGNPDDQRMEEKRMYAFAEAVFIFDEEGNVLYEFQPATIEGWFRD